MTTGGDDPRPIRSAASVLTWDPGTRVALLRFESGATVGASDAAELVATLTRWTGSSPAPFAVIAHATGLRSVDSDYRSKARAFFRRHRETALIAVVRPGPVIQIIAEMFRTAAGVRLKVFDTEAEARTWLRGQGIAA